MALTWANHRLAGKVIRRGTCYFVHFGFCASGVTPDANAVLYPMFQGTTCRRYGGFCLDTAELPTNLLEGLTVAIDLIINGTTVFGSSFNINPKVNNYVDCNLASFDNGATLQNVYNAFGNVGSGYAKSVSLAIKFLHYGDFYVSNTSGGFAAGKTTSRVQTWNFTGYLYNTSYVTTSPIVYSSGNAAPTYTGTLLDFAPSLVQTFSNNASLAASRSSNIYNIVSSSSYGNAAIKNTLGSPRDLQNNQITLADAIGKPSSNNLAGTPAGLHQVLGEPPTFTEGSSMGEHGMVRSIHSILGSFYDNPGYNISTLHEYLECFDESFSGLVSTYLGKIFRAVVKNQDVAESDPNFKTIYDLLSDYLGLSEDDYDGGVIPEDETVRGKTVIVRNEIGSDDDDPDSPSSSTNNPLSVKAQTKKLKMTIGSPTDLSTGTTVFAKQKKIEELVGNPSDPSTGETFFAKQKKIEGLLGTKEDAAGDTTVFARVKKLENLLGLGNENLSGLIINSTTGLDSKIAKLETVKSGLEGAKNDIVMAEAGLLTAKQNIDSSVSNLGTIKADLDYAGLTIKLANDDLLIAKQNIDSSVTALSDAHSTLADDVAGLPAISTTANSTHRSVTALNLLVERIRSVLSRRNK